MGHGSQKSPSCRSPRGWWGGIGGWLARVGSSERCQCRGEVRRYRQYEGIIFEVSRQEESISSQAGREDRKESNRPLNLHRSDWVQKNPS